MIRPDGSGLEQVTHDGAHSITRSIWSPDGERMLVFCFEEGARIIKLGNKASDNVERQLPPMPNPEQHFDPWSWSPDGKWIAGSRRPEMAGDAGVAVYSLENNKYEVLSPTGWLPVWLNDNQRLLFASHGKIFMTDRVSKETHEVFSMAPNTISALSQLSRDNRFLYFALLRREADVWLLTAQ
jgi:WD40-like Beta Propeller Repeat